MCAAFTIEDIEHQINSLTDELLNTEVFGSDEDNPESLNTAYKFIGKICDIMDKYDNNMIPEPEDEEKINEYINTITNMIRQYIDEKCKSLKKNYSKKIAPIEKFLKDYDKGLVEWDHTITSQLAKIDRDLKQPINNKKANSKKSKIQTVVKSNPAKIRWLMGGLIPNINRDKYFLYSENPNMANQKIRIYNSEKEARDYLNRLNNLNYEETEEEQKSTKHVLDEIEILMNEFF